MDTKAERHTIDYYDKEAESWASAHGGNEEESYWKFEMERFHQFLPGGKVLEIGSGTGKDASALMRMGYDYTGIDASEGLLKIAQRRNPGANFKKVSVYGLDFPPASFDGFWTVATLLHIPKSRIDEALQKIKKQVKKGGIGFITVKAGAGERADLETGRLFSYYSQGEFKEVLERNKFEVVENASRKGEKDWWLCYWVRN